MKYRISRNYVALVGFVLMGLARVSCSGEIPEKELARLINADSPKAANEVRKALFVPSRFSDWQGLTAHSNTSVALTAGWYCLCADHWQTRLPSRIDGRSAERFLGLVSRRLGIVPPQWWSEAVRAGVLHGTCESFKVPGWETRYQESSEHWPGSQEPIRVPAGLVVRSKDSRVVVATPTRTITVEFPNDLAPDVEQLDITCEGESCFIVASRDDSSQFPLFRVDANSTRPLWRANVWAADRQRSYGYGFNIVETMLSKECVVVFGAESNTVYVEGFEKSTGKARFRFSSWYDDSR